MGHIYVLCGPPGAGKTSLLKAICERRLHIKQRRRLTTRDSRKEEGDAGNTNLEYEFLQPVEFAERISKGRIASLIEWNGNYYATQISELDKSIETSEDSILLEDIPSAVALKDKFPHNVTIVFLFTASKDEMLVSLDFASYETSSNDHLREWRRRLGEKYNDAEKIRNREPSATGRGDYIKGKMKRAIPDLAFIVGKLRDNCDIRVIANRPERLEETANEFLELMNEPERHEQETLALLRSEEHLDPSKLKVGQIIRSIIGSMTAPQLWTAGSAIVTVIVAVLSAVAFAAYTVGKGGGP